MNRRSFFGWVAKAAAVAVIPVNLARKHTPLSRFWPLQEGTVDLGNGWTRTTKIYDAQEVGFTIPANFVFQYTHRAGWNIELGPAATPADAEANLALPPFMPFIPEATPKRHQA